jgi:hypothetical protein
LDACSSTAIDWPKSTAQDFIPREKKFALGFTNGSCFFTDVKKALSWVLQKEKTGGGGVAARGSFVSSLASAATTTGRLFSVDRRSVSRLLLPTREDSMQLGLGHLSSSSSSGSSSNLA